MASKETQQIVDNLTVMDDTFFHKLAEDMGFCEELIQTVLGNKNIRLHRSYCSKKFEKCERAICYTRRLLY